MANIKVVLRKNMKRKDGTIPLALRISENYKTNYTWIGHYVLEKDWDKNKGFAKNSHPNSKRLNNFILKKLNEANNIYFDSKETLSTTTIKRKLKNPTGSSYFFELAFNRVKNKYESGVFSVATSEISTLYNLIEFIELKKSLPKQEIISNIKERRKERIKISKIQNTNFIERNKHLKKYKKIQFRDIDEAFLNRYMKFCSIYLNQTPRTITNQLIFIRTVYNIAIKQGIADKRHYPFAYDKITIKIGSGNKIGYNQNEIKKIENLNLDYGSLERHAKNTWLFSFYFAGIRISDVIQLKWPDIKNDRLYYVMNKNDKPLSLAISPKAKKILQEYLKHKSHKNDYIFPFLKDADQNNPEDIFLKIKNATKQLNKYLNKIRIMCDLEKPLTNHIARHSFGNIAGESVHPLMLQKLYRHSDLKTTLNYQANFIHKEADDALDSVINF